MTEPVAPPDPATVPPFPALGSNDFNAEAYAHGSALPGVAINFGQQSQASYTNALAAKEKALAAGNSAETATIQADLAMGYRNAANTAANTATTKAGEAEASALLASKLNLGSKPSAPTVDNQGAVLLVGANYYDTTLGKLRVWSGSAWADGLSVVAGVTSLNGASGALTLNTLSDYGITDGVRTSSDQAIAGNKSFTGSVLLTGAGSFGYGPGAGGTATQATSKSSAVTLNKMSGKITMSNAALAGNTSVAFYLNNSLVSPGDTVLVSLFGGGSWVDNYSVRAGAANGGIVRIVLTNQTAGTLSDAVEIYLSVVKGAVA